MRTRSVLIVLFEGLASLDVSGPLNVFAGANRLMQSPSGRTPYSIVTAGPGGKPVRTAWGLHLTPDIDLDSAEAPHTLLVPGGLPDPQGEVALDTDVVAWLRQYAPGAKRVVSICSGTFLLAEAGLLTDRHVTAHWAQAAKLAAEQPSTRVSPDPIFIRDGHISTSAGALSGIDLALNIVEEDLGRDVAQTIARYLVVFLRRPGNQNQLSTQLLTQLASRPSVREVQHWIADHPTEDLSVEALAKRAHLSPRQFTRAFTAETGTSPGRFVDQTRLETARRLLDETDESIEHVARASGYPSSEAMRRAFQRTLSLSPARYRRAGEVRRV
ncbi:GlxA family transcriptional regulator [Kitasatospora sp. McL0602]|uniref:GlxA family transcriptional regulator n=1 Tax=Kitasatospora sp. McL0602 TaxID=3439530 RepID=UPI003F8C8DDF